MVKHQTPVKNSSQTKHHEEASLSKKSKGLNLIYRVVLGIAVIVIIVIVFIFTNKSGCEMGVKNYLKNADMVGSGQEVIVGNTISVHYIGRLDYENVFDTSVESVAKACGKYMTGRNYEEGLTFQVGGGQMIAGFDKAVVGMKVGQTKTISIVPEEAYGLRNEKNVLKMKKADIPNSDQFKKGVQLQLPNGQVVTVSEVTSEEIVFDGNHELAGKTLIFDITIKEIK